MEVFEARCYRKGDSKETNGMTDEKVLDRRGKILKKKMNETNGYVIRSDTEGCQDCPRKKIHQTNIAIAIREPDYGRSRTEFVPKRNRRDQRRVAWKLPLKPIP